MFNADMDRMRISRSSVQRDAGLFSVKRGNRTVTGFAMNVRIFHVMT